MAAAVPVSPTVTRGGRGGVGGAGFSPSLAPQRERMWKGMDRKSGSQNAAGAVLAAAGVLRVPGGETRGAEERTRLRSQAPAMPSPASPRSPALSGLPYPGGMTCPRCAQSSRTTPGRSAFNFRSAARWGPTSAAEAPGRAGTWTGAQTASTDPIFTAAPADTFHSRSRKGCGPGTRISVTSDAAPSPPEALAVAPGSSMASAAGALSQAGPVQGQITMATVAPPPVQ